LLIKEDTNEKKDKIQQCNNYRERNITMGVTLMKRKKKKNKKSKDCWYLKKKSAFILLEIML